MSRKSSINPAAISAAFDALRQLGDPFPSANKVREYMKKTAPPGTVIGAAEKVQEVLLKLREKQVGEMEVTTGAELPPALANALRLELQAVAERVKNQLSAERDVLLIDLQESIDGSLEQGEEIRRLGFELDAARSERDAAVGALNECRQSLDRSLRDAKSAHESKEAAIVELRGIVSERDAARSECDSLKQVLVEAQLAVQKLTAAAAAAEESRTAALARASSAEALAAALQAPSEPRRFFGLPWRRAASMRAPYRFKPVSNVVNPGRSD